VKPEILNPGLLSSRGEAVLNISDVATGPIAENITCLPCHLGKIKGKPRGVCDRHTSILGSFELNIVVHQFLDYHLNLLWLELEK
jgi:hypothetical protein